MQPQQNKTPFNAFQKKKYSMLPVVTEFSLMFFCVVDSVMIAR